MDIHIRMFTFFSMPWMFCGVGDLTSTNKKRVNKNIMKLNWVTSLISLKKDKIIDILEIWLSSMGWILQLRVFSLGQKLLFEDLCLLHIFSTPFIVSIIPSLSVPADKDLSYSRFAVHFNLFDLSFPESLNDASDYCPRTFFPPSAVYHLLKHTWSVLRHPVRITISEDHLGGESKVGPNYHLRLKEGNRDILLTQAKKKQKNFWLFK